MSKPNIIQFRELSAFANDLSTMRIVERDTPKGSDLFFKELLTEPFITPPLSLWVKSFFSPKISSFEKLYCPGFK